VSDFLAALERHSWDALVMVSSANNLFTVESVVKEKDEVHLMAQPVPSTEGCVGRAISRDSMFAKALLQGVLAKFRADLIPSVQNPGKLQAIIDGAPMGEFDTENEAMAFMRGFTWGFSVGGGVKNMADGLPSRLE
jgi:hypothetical protein